MEALRVRVYDVRFGDAILVAVPDQAGNGEPVTRHILIDMGNVQSGEGGEDAVFGPVMADILHQLDGRPLDLYVMSHEHLDHVQGLLYVAGDYGGEDGLRQKLQTRYAWLPASADPHYYDPGQGHDRAKKQLDGYRAAYLAIDRYLGAAPQQRNALVDALMLNNDANKTGVCVEYLRSLAGPNTWYVHRELDLAGKHPFRDASFELWGPEEDSSIYYGQFQPMALGVSGGEVAGGGPPILSQPIPPPGVDAGAFFDLVEAGRRGYLDNMLAIDKAANNTSVVFCLAWHAWRLLFPGDAERRSWRQMNKVGRLAPVDFLKVGHHGSANGTPPPELLDKVLPPGRHGYAALSTHLNTYNGVPDQTTLTNLRDRADLHSVLDLDGGLYFELAFAPDGRVVEVTTG